MPTSTSSISEIFSALFLSIAGNCRWIKVTGASQVLESLSKYKADTSALPKEQYQQRCERLNELYDTIEDQELQRWAKERIPSNTKGQRRFLKELLEKHSAISDWLIPNRAAFVGARSARETITPTDITAKER